MIFCTVREKGCSYTIIDKWKEQKHVKPIKNWVNQVILNSCEYLEILRSEAVL